MGKAHPLRLLLDWLFFFFRKCALLIWTFFLFNLRSQGLLRAGKRGRWEEQSARSASQQTGRRRTTTTTRVSKHFTSKCISIDKAEEVKPQTKPSVTNPIHCFVFSAIVLPAVYKSPVSASRNRMLLEESLAVRTAYWLSKKQKKQLKDDSVVNAGQQNTAEVKSEVKGAVMWHVCVVFLKIDKKKKMYQTATLCINVL